MTSEDTTGLIQCRANLAPAAQNPPGAGRRFSALQREYEAVGEAQEEAAEAAELEEISSFLDELGKDQPWSS